MAFDTGHAVLIGVGTYANAPNLNVPVTTADAEQMAAVLSDPRFCGYPSGQVTLLRDDQATRAGILQALDDLAARAAKGDTVFLFYSGHGHYGEDGAYYLTTNDMRLTANGKIADGTAIRQDELLASLQRLQAERVLLVFNACHSGEISPTLAADEQPFTGAPLPAPTAAALLSTGSGRVIITACRENQYAYVGDGANTIFVQALLDGLRGQGVTSQRGFISAFDLYTRLYFAVTDTVQKTVPAPTRQRYSLTQEPELTVLKGVGPFAVALYKGASATLGDFSAPERPADGTAMREVDEAESRAALAQFGDIQQTQSGGINFGVGARIGQMGDVVAGDVVGGDKVAGDKVYVHGSGAVLNQPKMAKVANDKVYTRGSGELNRPAGAVSQVFGQQRNIDTGGGDYAEGPIDKREGTFVQGSQYNVSGSFTGSNVNIGSTLTNVTQSIGAMPHGGEADKEQLKQLVVELNAALQQAPADRKDDAETVATFAQQLVDTAAKPQPNKSMIQITGAGLKQAAENIASVMPTVLKIATQIVEQIGKLVP